MPSRRAASILADISHALAGDCREIPVTTALMDEWTALIAQLSGLCHEVDHLLGAGFRAEAVRVASLTVPLMTELQAVFNPGFDLAPWMEQLTRAQRSAGLDLDPAMLNRLADAVARDQHCRELERAYRLACLAHADLPVRLSRLRALREADPANPAWSADLEELVAAWVATLMRQPLPEDEAALSALHGQIVAVGASVPPQLQARILDRRLAPLRQRLAALVAERDAAHLPTALAAITALGVDPTGLPEGRTALRIIAIATAEADYRAAIGRAGSLDALERADAAFARAGIAVPADLAQERGQRAAALRAAQRRERRVGIGILVAIGLLALAAGGTLWWWNHTAGLVAATHRTVSGHLDRQEPDQAAALLSAFAQDHPGLMSRPAMAELAQGVAAAVAARHACDDRLRLLANRPLEQLTAADLAEVRRLAVTPEQVRSVDALAADAQKARAAAAERQIQEGAARLATLLGSAAAVGDLERLRADVQTLAEDATLPPDVRQRAASLLAEIDGLLRSLHAAQTQDRAITAMRRELLDALEQNRPYSVASVLMRVARMAPHHPMALESSLISRIQSALGITAAWRQVMDAVLPLNPWMGADATINPQAEQILRRLAGARIAQDDNPYAAALTEYRAFLGRHVDATRRRSSALDPVAQTFLEAPWIRDNEGVKVGEIVRWRPAQPEPYAGMIRSPTGVRLRAWVLSSRPGIDVELATFDIPATSDISLVIVPAPHSRLAATLSAWHASDSRYDLAWGARLIRRIMAEPDLDPLLRALFLRQGASEAQHDWPQVDPELLRGMLAIQPDFAWVAPEGDLAAQARRDLAPLLETVQSAFGDVAPYDQRRAEAIRSLRERLAPREVIGIVWAGMAASAAIAWTREPPREQLVEALVFPERADAMWVPLGSAGDLGPERLTSLPPGTLIVRRR